jgi:hypothetical protein
LELLVAVDEGLADFDEELSDFDEELSDLDWPLLVFSLLALLPLLA